MRRPFKSLKQLEVPEKKTLILASLKYFELIYSVSTNFGLELIEPSAREVPIFWSSEKTLGE